MTIEYMWKVYRRKRTDALRNDLVLHYFHLAHSHAGRHTRKNSHITTDEFLGPASLGLIQAVEAYDPGKNVKFETFSYRRISGAIQDWLRELDLQARAVRQFEKKRDGLYFDDAASTEEWIDKLNITPKRYLLLDSLSQLGKEVHFSALNYKYNESEHEACFEDKEAQDPMTVVTRQVLIEFLGQGLARLERIILVTYYFDGLTLAEIADRVNLSESRVSQLRKRMLKRLKNKLMRAKEKELLV